MNDKKDKKEKKLEKKLKRPVFFPIKFKFLATQLTVFTISLIAFLAFTIDLILNDKTAYIYENSISHIESQSNFIEKFLSSELNSSLLLFSSLDGQNDLNSQRDMLERFSSQNLNFMDLTLYKKNRRKNLLEESFDFQNPKLERRFKGSAKMRRKHRMVFRELHDLIKSGEDRIFKIVTEKETIPHLFVAMRNKSRDKVYVFRYLVENIASDIFQSSSYTDFIVNYDGKVLIHSIPEDVNSDFYDIYQPVFNEIIENKTRSGVQTIEKPGLGEFLVSFKINNQFEIMIFSEISRNKAFEFTKLIIVKTIIFGLFVGVLIYIISLIFSQTITRPLDKLMNRTKKLSEGDFKSTVSIWSGDEISKLANSFNFMTSKLDTFLMEMKDKGRMESELQTAKIVQDSLFPLNQVKEEKYELFGHYQSASECGGDWWGYKFSKGKLYLFVGDATGHGVPAALVTASVSSGCQTIVNYIEDHDDEDYVPPDKILTYLNKVVKMTGGDAILMTFFVAVYDPEKRTLEYSNASHNFPLIYKYKDGKPTKKDVKALAKAISRRLGDKPDTVYESETIDIAPNDVLLLFSDGVIEAYNPEGIIWGERKFMKSFYTMAQKDARKIVDNILSDAFKYYEGVEPDDDVTLVAAKFF
ncbi:MAG: SpoIIE family protein phosphatase [Bacteriovoracaceae bacterium]|nr:SpoIIE family protein phosphatase [Bacteriovoracaceae bacterium]